MTTTKLKAAFLIGLAFCAFVLSGCGTPQTTLSSKPEEQMNPMMSQHQKELRLAKSQQAQSNN
jgi:hypothetical protein